jgi:hypothetical protein
VPGTVLDVADWTSVARSLVQDGWIRLAGVVSGRTCARLVGAAPITWEPEPEVVGGVHQSAVSTGLSFDRAAPSVRAVGLAICDAMTDARPPGTPAIPRFNEVRRSRSQEGAGPSITAHRDPPLCGGVIATVTLFGQARFRVWSGADVVEWETTDGDLVLLGGNGWPTETSRCPMHEAASPTLGHRMILTYRYNKGGPGARYFA